VAVLTAWQARASPPGRARSGAAHDQPL